MTESAGARLLWLVGLVFGLGTLAYFAPWVWLDALIGLFLVIGIWLWATVTEPGDEYWIELERKRKEDEEG